MRCTDPIADLLTRIRNGQSAKKEVIVVPASKMKISVTHLLKQEGMIRDYRCVRDDKQGLIKIALKYNDSTEKGVINFLTRQSKPGLRIYKSSRALPYVKGGYGFGIYSTSKGLMTDHQCRKNNVGGEYICSVF